MNGNQQFGSNKRVDETPCEVGCQIPHEAGLGIPEQNDRRQVLEIMERANTIASEPKVLDLIDGMLDLMIEITGSDSANYFKFEPDPDEFVCQTVRGEVDSQYLIGLRLKRQLFLPGLTINGQQPTVIGDLPPNQHWVRTIHPRNASQKQNIIDLPICGKERLLGFIQIFNYQEAELDLLQVLTRRLSTEIEHRNAMNAMVKSNQRLNTLVDVLGEVAGTLDRNRLLHMVAENASRLVEAERSSVFLVDPETKEMVFQVAYRSPEENGDSPPQHRRLVESRGDEFSYFNRTAVTVPIHNIPMDPNQDVQHVLGGLMALNKQNAGFEAEDAQLLQILANQASTFLQVAEMYESAEELFLGVIQSLANAIDAKDPYTKGHSQRVSDYSMLISKELGLDSALMYEVRIGSLLHDIGKIGIPDSILLKKGKLTVDEYEGMKRHPSIGLNILSQVKLLEPMLPAIVEHHERLDGSGYPYQLKGQEISLMGRIVAVADVFDAMASDRYYRSTMMVDEVLRYLHENAERKFDRDCVQALSLILARSRDLEMSE